MPYKRPIAGVYCIKAINSKLIYIGASKSMKLRRNLHFSAMKRNDTRRYCKALNITLAKGDVLEFEVLELCDNLLEREQYYIDLYRQSSEWTIVNVFNADRVKSSVTDEFRHKMSVVLKKRFENPEYKNWFLSRGESTRFKKGSNSNKGS